VSSGFARLAIPLSPKYCSDVDLSMPRWGRGKFVLETLRRSSTNQFVVQLQRPRLRRAAVTLHALCGSSVAKNDISTASIVLPARCRMVTWIRGLSTAPNGPRSRQFARRFALHRGGESSLFFTEEAGAVWLRASVASFAKRSAFSRAVLSMIARLAAS
jgi:hypothetical protein